MCAEEYLKCNPSILEIIGHMTIFYPCFKAGNYTPKELFAKLIYAPFGDFDSMLGHLMRVYRPVPCQITDNYEICAEACQTDVYVICAKAYQALGVFALIHIDRKTVSKINMASVVNYLCHDSYPSASAYYTALEQKFYPALVENKNIKLTDQKCNDYEKTLQKYIEQVKNYLQLDTVHASKHAAIWAAVMPAITAASPDRDITNELDSLILGIVMKD
jgi:hypothetical protein